MTQTTKTLKLNFLNSANKTTSLLLPDAAGDLDAASVKDAMAVIAQENIFNKEEVEMYQVPKSASYIERTVTELFNAEDTIEANV